MSRRHAHIATVGAPIVSHVLPSLALIRELVARGHRVTYANDPFMADFIHSSGAELVPCTSPLPVADNNRPADPIAPASLFLDDAVQAIRPTCTSTTSAPTRTGTGSRGGSPTAGRPPRMWTRSPGRPPASSP